LLDEFDRIGEWNTGLFGDYCGAGVTSLSNRREGKRVLAYGHFAEVLLLGKIQEWTPCKV